jgi:hypothetical protein
MRKLIQFSVLFLSIFTFLSFNVSRVEAATLYFNGGTNSDWGTITNWWQDAGFSSQALTLPTVGDDVIISATVASNTVPPASVNTMTVSGTAQIVIPVTVANGATFNDDSEMNDTLTGNATFNDTSCHTSAETITGNAIFNDSSCNSGDVLGDATFYGDLSVSSGDVFGTKTRYYTSNTTTVLDFRTFGVGDPWTVVADGAGVVVDITGAFFEATTIFQELNGGTFVGLPETLYWYNDGIDANWATLADNWWTDINHTVQALALPTNHDLVITLGTIGPDVDVDTWTAPLSINASATGIDFTGTSSNSVNLPITGDATFSGEIRNRDILTGNAVFNNSSFNADDGTITGNATFNNTAFNIGTVSGDAIFNLNSYNENLVEGGATFNDSSYNKTGFVYEGTINLNAIFNDSSYNDATVNSDATFNDSSFNQATVNADATFNDSSFNNGTVLGDSFFYNFSRNNNNITGDAEFNDLSCNGGTVNGNAIFMYAHAGIITIADGGTWCSGTANLNIGDDALIITSWEFNGNSYNDEGTIDGNITFNDTSSNVDGAISGNIIFNDSSFNDGGTVSGTVTFNDLSYNDGIVTGDATFTYASDGAIVLIGSQAWGEVQGTARGVDGNQIINYVFNNDSNFNGSVLNGNAIFNNNSYQNGGTITGIPSLFTSSASAVGQTGATLNGNLTNGGNTIFNDNSQNYGQVSINATFNDSSINDVAGTVTGDLCLNDLATNDGAGNEVPCPVSTALVSERGFNYGLDNTYGTNIVQNSGPYDVGTFDTVLTGLTCGTTYHFRAYATNASGTTNGSDATFTTSACPTGGGSSSGSRPNKTTTTIITPSNTVTVSTACPVGHLFSTSTGLPCKTFFTPSNNTCVITQTLRQGDKGDQVKCLQTGLNILNDGIFGPMTKAAVISFQQLHNLVPDGIFGPKSLEKWGR